MQRSPTFDWGRNPLTLNPKPPNQDDSKDSAGYTPLHVAIRQKCGVAQAVLEEMGAPKFSRDPWNC